MKHYSFSKKERLRKNCHIQAVFEKGVLYKTKRLHIYLFQRPDSVSHINRCAFICKRDLYRKNIVLRNRIRRILREAYRKNKNILPRNKYDIVIVAQDIEKDIQGEVIEGEVKKIFSKIRNYPYKILP